MPSRTNCWYSLKQLPTVGHVGSSGCSRPVISSTRLLPSWRLLTTGVADMPSTPSSGLRRPAWETSSATFSTALRDQLVVALLDSLDLVDHDQVDRLGFHQAPHVLRGAGLLEHLVVQDQIPVGTGLEAGGRLGGGRIPVLTANEAVGEA